MLGNLEDIQNEVKDFMKKKNKLKEDLAAKEIENNLKIDKLKNDISTVRKEIKDAEGILMENVKEQKTVKIIIYILLCKF